MDRLQKIATRKAELKAQLEGEAKDLDLEAIKSEIDALEVEEKSIKEAQEAEARKAQEEAEKRKKEAEELEKKNLAKPIEKKEVKETMELKDILSSKEYRSAFAKTLMGVSLNDAEKKALGDAVITTDPTFVPSAEGTQGINNGGLLIPTQLRTDLLENIYQESPFLRDVRKMQVNGNIDLPYTHEADDAQWYAELTDTKNEGQEYKKISLTGHELAKDIEITWKAEKMTVDSFLSFLLDELTMKMGRALATAVLYGDGNGKPTGVMNGLNALTDADPFQAISKAKMSLSSIARIRAKAYISEEVENTIVFTKDNEGRYPYLQGLPRISSMNVEVDPFLQNTDIVVGNPKYYILNEVEGVSLDKEKKIKGRKVVYGAYAIYDGKAKPNHFAKAQVVSSSI